MGEAAHQHCAGARLQCRSCRHCPAHLDVSRDWALAQSVASGPWHARHVPRPGAGAAHAVVAMLLWQGMLSRGTRPLSPERGVREQWGVLESTQTHLSEFVAHTLRLAKRGPSRSVGPHARVMPAEMAAVAWQAGATPFAGVLGDKCNRRHGLALGCSARSLAG